MLDENNPTNIEILRIARDLAYSDYNNRKAELHNQWLSESDYMWRTKRLRVAYPPIPKYPTEQDIVARAEKLLEFLQRPRPDLEELKLPEPIQASEVPKKEVAKPLPSHLEKQVQQALDKVVENHRKTEAIENNQDISGDVNKDGGILPSVKNFFKF